MPELTNYYLIQVDSQKDTGVCEWTDSYLVEESVYRQLKDKINITAAYNMGLCIASKTLSKKYENGHYGIMRNTYGYYDKLYYNEIEMEVILIHACPEDNLNKILIAYRPHIKNVCRKIMEYTIPYEQGYRYNGYVPIYGNSELISSTNQIHREQTDGWRCYAIKDITEATQEIRGLGFYMCEEYDEQTPEEVFEIAMAAFEKIQSPDDIDMTEGFFWDIIGEAG